MKQGPVVVPCTSEHDVTDMIEMQGVHGDHLLTDTSTILWHNFQVHQVTVLTEQLDGMSFKRLY